MKISDATIEKVAEAICHRRNESDWPCNGLDFDTEMAKAAITALLESGEVVLAAPQAPNSEMDWDNFVPLPEPEKSELMAKMQKAAKNHVAEHPNNKDVMDN